MVIGPVLGWTELQLLADEPPDTNRIFSHLCCRESADAIAELFQFALLLHIATSLHKSSVLVAIDFDHEPHIFGDQINLVRSAPHYSGDSLISAKSTSRLPA